MSAKWKIKQIYLTDVGSADSVEVVKFRIGVSDSIGTGYGFGHEETIPWVPKQSIYYADSASARGIGQDSAFDDWIENIDSEHRTWMERVEWTVKTRMWESFTDLSPAEWGDSYNVVKSVPLDDSAPVVNPLGL